MMFSLGGTNGTFKKGVLRFAQSLRAMDKDDQGAQGVQPAMPLMLDRREGCLGGTRHAVFAGSLAEGTQDDGEKGYNLLQS
jgi:hypothetical protein